MISSDLRHALARAVAAAGFGRAVDPGLRSTGTPGQYAASAALALGGDPRATARTLAAALAGEPWVAAAEVTGPGYLTITVTPEALAAVADNVAAAGPGCVTSDALAGLTVPAAPGGDPLAARTWEQARSALAARLTVRLATAAGATVAEFAGTERKPLSHQANIDSGPEVSGIRSADSAAEPDACPRSQVARAIGYAGRDAVLFTLARAIPGKPLRVEPEIIARHVLGNPAYAVRYAHARAASGVRWAVTSSAADTIGSEETPRRLPADPGSELVVGGYGGSSPREAAALLDALSWLPERVATAARRGRPDEFARYLEELASVTVDVLSAASHPGKAAAAGSDRLALARAARTGLATGLGLLEVSAPDRL